MVQGVPSFKWILIRLIQPLLGAPAKRRGLTPCSVTVGVLSNLGRFIRRLAHLLGVVEAGQVKEAHHPEPKH